MLHRRLKSLSVAAGCTTVQIGGRCDVTWHGVLLVHAGVTASSVNASQVNGVSFYFINVKFTRTAGMCAVPALLCLYVYTDTRERLPVTCQWLTQQSLQ